MIAEALASLGAIKTATDILRSMQELLKRNDLGAVQEKVTELQNSLLEISSRNLEIQQQAQSLTSERDELRTKLFTHGKVQRVGRLYFEESSDDGCCTRCWEVDRRLVSIIPHQDAKGYRKWGCPQCKSLYDIQHATRPSIGTR